MGMRRMRQLDRADLLRTDESDAEGQRDGDEDDEKSTESVPGKPNLRVWKDDNVPLLPLLLPLEAPVPSLRGVPSRGSRAAAEDVLRLVLHRERGRLRRLPFQVVLRALRPVSPMALQNLRRDALVVLSLLLLSGRLDDVGTVVGRPSVRCAFELSDLRLQTVELGGEGPLQGDALGELLLELEQEGV